MGFRWLMMRLAIVGILAAVTGAVACSPPGERPSEVTTTTTEPTQVTTTTTTEPTTTSVAPSTGHGSLAECLSKHGVPAAPGPTAGPPSGVDAATWEKAMAECSSLAPGPPGP